MPLATPPRLSIFDKWFRCDAAEGAGVSPPLRDKGVHLLFVTYDLLSSPLSRPLHEYVYNYAYEDYHYHYAHGEVLSLYLMYHFILQLKSVLFILFNDYNYNSSQSN